LEKRKLVGIITLAECAGFLRRNLLINGALKKVESG